MRSGRAVILSDYVGGEGAASGGAGHAALDSYRALRDAGAEVRMIAGFGDAPAAQRSGFASLGGSDLRAGARSTMLRAIYNPSAKHALARELKGEDRETTLIVLHQWTRYLSPAAIGLVDRFPTMIYMHDYFWPCPNGAYYDFAQQRPCDRQPMGMRCLTANCDRQGRALKAGRVVRQAAREMLTRASPERRLFLHLSSHARRVAAPLLPGERHAIVHNSLNMTDAAPDAAAPVFAFGYFGRLEPEKGVGDLLAAIDGHSALFVGDGSLAPRLTEHEGVTHRAWQPRAAMAAAMRSCSLVVLPSRWDETWGLIVPEAMAAGVGVLVSVRAGSAELVRRFGGGRVFDPAIPGDLATQLDRALREGVPRLDRAGLRRLLSGERHAALILRLGRERFGLDLRLSPTGISGHAPSTAGARPPAVRLPLPR